MQHSFYNQTKNPGATALRCADALTGIGSYGYTLDLDGKRLGATLPDGKSWAYGYDGLNQVTGGTLSDGAIPVSSHAYTYDTIGNRLTAADNDATKQYIANDLNQYTAINDASLRYDADGNLLSDGELTYTYDALNQLISVEKGFEKQLFRYDFMGRRIASERYTRNRLTSRRRYIYQQWNVIAEYENGEKVKTCLWGEDLSGTLQGAGGVGGLLLERNATGDYLPIYDGNGNIVAYNDATGNTVATYSYDPFGNIIAHTGMDFNYKFSTKPQDELSGLYYYGYRFYSPKMGRWVNRDPIGEQGGTNLYTAVINNLLCLYDLLGKMNVAQAITWDITGMPSTKELIRLLCILQKLGASKDPELRDTYSMLQKIIANGSVLFGNGFLKLGEAVTIYGQPSMIIDAKEAENERELLGLLMHEARHHVSFVSDLTKSGATYYIQDKVTALIDAAKFDVTRYACCINKKVTANIASRYKIIVAECSRSPFVPCQGGSVLGTTKTKFSPEEDKRFKCDCEK